MKNETISLRLSEEELALLNAMIMKESLQKGEQIGTSEFIRKALFSGEQDNSINDLKQIDDIIMNSCVGIKLLISSSEQRKQAKENAFLGNTPKITCITEPMPLYKKNFTIRDTISDFIDKKVFQEITQHGTLNSWEFQRTTCSQQIDVALGQIMQKNLFPTKIVCGCQIFNQDIKHNKKFDEAAQKDVIINSLYGHLEHCDVHVSNQIDPNSIIVMPQGEQVGELNISWHAETFCDREGFGTIVFAKAEINNLKKNSIIITAKG